MKAIVNLGMDLIQLSDSEILSKVQEESFKKAEQRKGKYFKVRNGRIEDVAFAFKFRDKGAEKKLKDSFDFFYLGKEEEAKRNKYPYGHPFLRTCVDSLTAVIISNLKTGFVDIGSKFHKIQRMTNLPFVAFRGDFAEYD